MGIISWYHHRKFKKVKQELLNKPLKEWTDEHGRQHKINVDEYFRIEFIKDPENSDCDKIALYWKDFENSLDISLDLDNYFNQEIFSWHYYNFPVYKLVGYVFEDIKKNFKKFDGIKDVLIDCTYLKNYRIYNESSWNSSIVYATKVHLQPYIFADYIKDIKEYYKSSKDFTEDIINKYRTRCLEEFAEYKRVNADEPDIETYTIESWYSHVYKPSVDLEARTKECQATIDEINKIKEKKNK